jgi:hypothetical protein
VTREEAAAMIQVLAHDDSVAVDDLGGLGITAWG